MTLIWYWQFWVPTECCGTNGLPYISWTTTFSQPIMTLFKVLAISLFFLRIAVFWVVSELLFYFIPTESVLLPKWSMKILFYFWFDFFPSSVALCLHLLPASFCTFKGEKHTAIMTLFPVSCQYCCREMWCLKFLREEIYPQIYLRYLHSFRESQMHNSRKRCKSRFLLEQSVSFPCKGNLGYFVSSCFVAVNCSATLDFCLCSKSNAYVLQLHICYHAWAVCICCVSLIWSNTGRTVSESMLLLLNMSFCWQFSSSPKEFEAEQWNRWVAPTYFAWAVSHRFGVSVSKVWCCFLGSGDKCADQLGQCQCPGP